MSQKYLAKRWRYLIALVLGIVVFASVIPSCTAFSSNSDAFVRVSKSQQQADLSEVKSWESIVENLPTAAEILEMPLSPHPRLLASESRFAEIKKQIETDETMKKWYEKLNKDAKACLEKELPIYRLKDNRSMVGISRRVLTRVTTLALMYRLDQNESYLQRVWQELKNASEFPDWNPSHFLDTAEMTFAFAIGYDWLYDFWDQKQKQLISTTILEKGLKPALSGYYNTEKWTITETNWNQVCNGGIGVGSLAILDDYSSVASQALYNALIRLPKAMQHYAPDGGYDEGTSYWHYGSRYNTIILSSLDTALNHDFNLSQIKGFSKTGFFPIYMTNATGIPFNFADSHERILHSPELFWMADKFHQPLYSTYQKRMAKPEVLDLIWYKPLKNNSSLKELPLDKYFRGSEVVSMRSNWEDQKGVFVGFKGGDNKANHSNLDLGTFILEASGVRWAVELGNDSYSLPGYFNENGPRWNYYRTRAEGQNIIVIDPDEKPDQNYNSTAKITAFNSNPKQVIATANLTPAYNTKASEVYRTITLDRQQKKVFIEDQIKSENPIEAWWFMHTKADIEISKDKQTAILSQGGSQLKVKVTSKNSKYEFEVLQAEPLSTSPNPKGQRKNVGVKKLAVHLENVINENLNVSFITS